MKFTFGICTTKKSSENVDKILESIYGLKIPNQDFEIIVIGGKKITNFNLKHYNFFEYSFDIKQTRFRKGWITKKKNMIAKLAKFENIVFLHDYIIFDPDWYLGFRDFKSEFDVCMNPIKNPDGSRYRDWTLWPRNNNAIDDLILTTRECLLPYSEVSLTKHMYISGAYWIAKKKFMLDNPLNESKIWGEAEDVEWSLRIRNFARIAINDRSVVKLLKFKDPAFIPILQSTLKAVKECNSLIIHNEWAGRDSNPEPTD